MKSRGSCEYPAAGLQRARADTLPGRVGGCYRVLLLQSSTWGVMA